MRTPGAPPRRRGALLEVIPILLAAWYVGVLVQIFALRASYPMDLEWMEGGQLYHAYRLLQGEPLWGAPSQGFVPYGYAPLHALLLAGLGYFFGLDYAMGRALSATLFLAMLLVLFLVVRRHAGRDRLALALATLAAAVAIAGFPVTGGWYDLVRNDSLALALPVATAALAGMGEYARRPLGWIVISLGLVATVYAKQTGVVFVGWIVLYLCWKDFSVGWRVALVSSLLSLGVYLTFQLMTDGWFLTWVTLMGKHPVEPSRFWAAFKLVVRFAPFLLGVPLVLLVLLRRRWLSDAGILWLGMLVCALPASLLPYAKGGGYLNNLMPIVVLSGPVTLILLVDLLHGAKHAGRTRLFYWSRIGILVGASVYLVWKAFPVSAHVPDEEMWAAAARMNTFVRALQGGVIMPEHSFLPARNGISTPQLHLVAHWDATMAGLPGVDVADLVRVSRAEWVIIGEREQNLVLESGELVPAEEIVPQARVMTGWVVSPLRLFHRAGKASAAAAPAP